MDAMTKAMLREAGFESGSVSELLGLDATQEAIVETKVRLTALLRKERKARQWTQSKLAEAIGTRQQVVARAETGHRSVTLDLLFRALLALGISLGRIARELEAGETFLSEQSSAGGVELVEIAPIPGLVRPERVARNSSISEVKPLLKMVQTESMTREHVSLAGSKTTPRSKKSGSRAALAA